jgi:predicted transcriptional regulator
VDKQFLIRDIPPDTDQMLNLLAVARRVPKWIVIRDALIEYVTKHKREIATTVKDDGRR